MIRSRRSSSLRPPAGPCTGRDDELAQVVQQLAPASPWSGRLGDERQRAELQAALARLLGGDDADRDVPRGMSFLSRSRTRQPSMSGRQMSSVMASGLYSRAIARAAAPSEVTRPLKPFSRAASSRKRAKPGRSRRSAGRGRRAGCVAVVADLVDQRGGSVRSAARRRRARRPARRWHGRRPGCADRREPAGSWLRLADRCAACRSAAGRA